MDKSKRSVSEYDLQDLLPVAMVFVVTGIGIAFGLNVMGDIRADYVTGSQACGTNSTGGTGGTIVYTSCGAEYNATTDAIEGVSKIPSKMPILATIVVAAIIIGILMRYLFVRYG